MCDDRQHLRRGGAQLGKIDPDTVLALMAALPEAARHFILLNLNCATQLSRGYRDAAVEYYRARYRSAKVIKLYATITALNHSNIYHGTKIDKSRAFWIRIHVWYMASLAGGRPRILPLGTTYGGAVVYKGIILIPGYTIRFIGGFMLSITNNITGYVYKYKYYIRPRLCDKLPIVFDIIRSSLLKPYRKQCGGHGYDYAILMVGGTTDKCSRQITHLDVDDVVDKLQPPSRSRRCLLAIRRLPAEIVEQILLWHPRAREISRRFDAVVRCRADEYAGHFLAKYPINTRDACIRRDMYGAATMRVYCMYRGLNMIRLGFNPNHLAAQLVSHPRGSSTKYTLVSEYYDGIVVCDQNSVRIYRGDRWWICISIKSRHFLVFDRDSMIVYQACIHTNIDMSDIYSTTHNILMACKLKTRYLSDGIALRPPESVQV